MNVFQLHTRSFILLAFNYVCWIFSLFIVLHRTRWQQSGCDFTIKILPLFLLPMIIISSVLFIIKALKSKEPLTTDYFIFTGLVLLPMVISVGIMMFLI